METPVWEKTFLSHCIAKRSDGCRFFRNYFTAAGIFDYIYRKCVFGSNSDEEDETMDHIYGCDL